MTEWWYYTGHLHDDAGGRWGFEFVIFRAERGGFPVTWASHLALTDEIAGTFTYDQRSEIGPQVGLVATDGFYFLIHDRRPDVTAPVGPPWSMRGDGDGASLGAAFTGDGASDLYLNLHATRPPVLHDTDGWIDFGPAGGSYYYSRTRLQVEGGLTVDGRLRRVDGSAWFDHQWGDFISVGGGGWDWFAINLDDGTDLTVSLVRAADGAYPLVYGTLVDLDGTVHHLDRDAFTVQASGAWTSPHSGATYPAGWTIRLPARQLVIGLEPSVADQELDSRATTGVVYWEGSQRVTATRGDGQALSIGGQAYVELTGYAR